MTSELTARTKAPVDAFSEEKMFRNIGPKRRSVFEESLRKRLETGFWGVGEGWEIQKIENRRGYIYDLRIVYGFFFKSSFCCYISMALLTKV